ncbi:hypothetical protein [Phenylobacterium soli]|uniref:Uncharacterized protein n=1 Tax=Phenylobacterium soli TaxID=2170551 RepID=A0A328AKT5_9CAUL|nr:hypothetical protein [Phenylobacterium soli]RAK54646.1 hypothetical protein DJ017_08985 [Phenylobacterium soli]
MTTPHPSHLDQRDPAKADVRDIREEVDREIEVYARDLHDLVLLVPEDSWDEFLKLSGCVAENEATLYRGVMLRKGPVTAVVVQEGF